jgi:hypothetical protein
MLCTLSGAHSAFDPIFRRKAASAEAADAKANNAEQHYAGQERTFGARSIQKRRIHSGKEAVSRHLLATSNHRVAGELTTAEWTDRHRRRRAVA